MKNILITLNFLFLYALTTFAQTEKKVENWKEGFLDIHFINTGSGNTNFLVLPDGTTLLIDAGILNRVAFEKKYAPLKVTAPVPNDTHSPAEWIALYIQNAMPKQRKPTIDYALITHFHDDHYGSLVELGKMIPIKNMIDRAYPNYNFPLDLKTFLAKDTIFQNYLTFLKDFNVSTQSLKAGSHSQIKPLVAPEKHPNFHIRNVKANGTIWTGKGDETLEYFKAEDMTTFYKGRNNENPLSLALKITYGDFDFFAGGDNTGLQGFGMPTWFDVETPMAKAVGKVEAMTLNHHGNRDATNDFFINTLDPKVVIQQLWCSDHPGQEVYQRLIYKDENTEGGRDIFTTNMHAETLVTYGPWFKDNYKNTKGHLLIRVQPDGKQYNVYVLDETRQDLTIKQVFGAYFSK